MKITAAEFLRSVARLEDVPKDLRPRVAFAGRSNVGKSALINLLLNRKGLAQTSKAPGKTRMLNFYLVNDAFYVVDLPGYGYAKVPSSVREIWVNLLEEYLRRDERLRLVVWLLDARRDPSPEDGRMWDLLSETGLPVAVAATKCDKMGAGRLRERIDRIRSALGLPNSLPVVPTSARKRIGRQEILNIVAARLRGKD